MANVCEFEMVVRGDMANIEKFLGALSQKGNVWMGRGAKIVNRVNGERMVNLDGECKWSIQSSLIDNAESMRRQAETGKGHWADLPENTEFLTLFEACEKYGVNMEVYSSEPGMAFQEHLMYENGNILNDDVLYEEVYDPDTDEIVDTVGGYSSWDFSVADVDVA